MEMIKTLSALAELSDLPILTYFGYLIVSKH